LELDARKVGALEDRILKRSDLVTTITEEDAAAFRRRRSGVNIEVLSPGYGGARVDAREITAAVPRRAVIAGSMLWRVKQFDLLALLRIADERFAAAGAEIAVIGEAPPEFEAEVLRTTTATKMLGRVDSFEDSFAQARLALISEPHGGGFKLKTLDYAFHRVPMIVQAQSVTGLPLADGDGLLEFADIEALVDGALAVLDDFEALNRLQTVAYEKCENAFEWSQRGSRFRDAVRAARPA
jgi:glycosyltransferase involved in cell wall biosynthesis